MFDVLGVVYCLSIFICAIALVVLAVVDVVEHFQYKQEMKIFEKIDELEVEKNEDNA